MPGWIGPVRRLIFGRPVPSHAHLAHRLPVSLALPIFASDAVSSVAYGTEEVLIVLAGAFAYSGAGSASGYLMYLALPIAILIAIVAFSYRQAIAYYPTSGGSYAVAKGNLGVYPGLVAAAALVIDYIMTVAVSVSAGVAALTSAFPILHSYKVWLAVVLVVFIALINLRGVRESGLIFALPAYAFIGSVLLLSVVSCAHYFFGSVFGPVQLCPLPTDPILPVSTLGMLVFLRAFSNGCSALTGVEAVSNGVSAFKVPEVKHAQQTLVFLAVILILMFLGVSFSAHIYHVVPSHVETVLSQLARASFGDSLLGNIGYQVITYATLLILMIAANTSYAGFPRLLSIVAADGYAPRIFTQLGDKLVFNRGIYMLTLVSVMLINVFKASVNALIPLYAVGVFLCFTLSQVGMVRRLRLDHKPGWQMNSVISAVGAAITGIVTLVVVISKFAEGAWMVVILIPLLVVIARSIKAHYDWFVEKMIVGEQAFRPLRNPADPLTAIVLLKEVDQSALEALDKALDMVGDRPNSTVLAVHFEVKREKTPHLLEQWDKYVKPYVGSKVSLEIKPASGPNIIPSVLNYIDRLCAKKPVDRIVAVIPEFETGNLFTQARHNASARRLYKALLERPRITIVSSRYFSREPDDRLAKHRPTEPLTVITLLSDINRGALEGLDCALDIAGGRKNSHVSAVHIELVPEFTERLRERWRRYIEPYVGKNVRLDVQPSPYRWLVPPVLEYIERLRKERPEDRIVVVVAEFETGNVITHFLHNASARRLVAALLGRQHVTAVTCRFFIRENVGLAPPAAPGKAPRQLAAQESPEDLPPGIA